MKNKSHFMTPEHDKGSIDNKKDSLTPVYKEKWSIDKEIEVIQ